MVEDRYKAFIEEHLRVSNRNLRKVGLDGAKPLSIGQCWMFSSTLVGVGRFDNEGGTAEISLSSLLREEGFYIFVTIFRKFEKEEVRNDQIIRSEENF
ncbi:hypothetical protein HNQ80_001987 [Anaerosolibacter carboniphilus]|uniref:Uncharacterized protein n=1 Tax=Anaerosolibacter carboniphilus TaxID=1417629 RepID=A0A841KQX1_9FIRM|nr:hypothetical protein [Anaerosolibacter carboniphilus]